MGEKDDSKGNDPGSNIEAPKPALAEVGEADDQSPTTSTAAGTAVTLTPFNKIFHGVTAGEALKFPLLVGADLEGQTWSGSYSMIADGTRTFQGRNLTRSREVITLQVAGGIPTISISTKYFEVADAGIYQIVFNTGVSYLPVAQSPLPDVAKIGDSGSLGTFAGSDTSTVTVTWELKPAFSGLATLEISSVVHAGAMEATEIDSYLLDSTGIPTTVTLSATTMGTTVTLSGKRSLVISHP